MERKEEGHKKEIINIWKNDNNWLMGYPRPVYTSKERTIEHWIVNFVLYFMIDNQVDGYEFGVDLGRTDRYTQFNAKNVSNKFHKARKAITQRFLEYTQKGKDIEPFDEIKLIGETVTKDWGKDAFWEQLKKKYKNFWRKFLKKEIPVKEVINEILKQNQ